MVAAAARGRAWLARIAASSLVLRRVMARTGEELRVAAASGAALATRRAANSGAGHPSAAPAGVAASGPAGGSIYTDAYFGVGRDAGGDREGRSGYAVYDRIASNADIAAYLLWRNFQAHRTLDVGCAVGHLVEALAELGVDAHGCDVSPFAVEHAAPGAAGRLKLGDLTHGLPYQDAAFDLVSTLEILEHLEPHAVPAAIAELRRVCRGALYATIPSFGPNRSGPDGHFDGKVRPERLDHFLGLGPGFEGPVPREDLALDIDGRPIEGHLTIASFEWWTARFADAGFERRPDVERRLYADIAPAGLGRFWNLYVFVVPGAPSTLTEQRHPEKSLSELGLSHPLLEHAAMEAAIAEEG